MPYVLPTQREYLDTHDDPRTVGDLNYLITKLCLYYLEEYTEGNYADFNSIIGVLECAKLEMYRRMVAPYEDNKIEENGDVYP